MERESTLPPVESAVVRVARDARDPRMKGIVLSRLFDDDVEPQRIGRFTLLDRLGEGGMGVVYAAYDEQLDRKVAVKVLRPLASAELSQGSDRLLREARAMARLSHPNIVTVHEAGLHEGEVFVAMEYVRGESLERWLPAVASRPDDPRAPGTSAPRPWREVLEVFRAAGRGLEAAHRSGIVHRDFKPHNVVLSEQGEVKVLDFGLARVLGSSSVPASESTGTAALTLTRTGMVMGTPAYMAPEQHDGAPADALSDQFSFFASLYHVLHGRLPFPTDSVHRFAEAAARGEVLPPPPDSAVPRWLERALRRGLSPDPQARFPSMTEALGTLDRDRSARWRWASGLGVLGLVAGASAVAATSMETPTSVACDRGSTELAEVWSAPSSRALAEGLRTSGSPAADETWERLRPRLDAYAEAWIAARDDACVAHRDGDHSAALYDRQVACLERRRASFGSLVDLLTVADRSTVERALPAALALPDLDRCTRASALLRSIPPPDDPTIAREVEAQRRVLAAAREHEALGQYEAGIERARAALGVAEGLGYRPLLAEAHVRLGSLTMEHGPPDDADRHLTAALTHALASAHSAAAMEAVARRIFVRSERLRAPERAVDDVALGEGLLERVSDDPRLVGLYLNNVGAHHIRREADDEARAVLLEALRVKREGLGTDDPELAYTLGNLSLVEQRAGNDEPARAYLDEALALTERVLGPHHPMTAEVARLRGERLLHGGRLRAAGEAMEAVLEILQRTTGERSALRHGPLTMLGEVALLERDYARARERFEQAAALDLPDDSAPMYRVLDDVGRARALIGLGRTESGWATFSGALDRAEQSQAPYLSALRVLWTHTLLLHGRPEPALAAVEPLVEHERRSGPSHALAASLLAKARALRRLGRLDLAQSTLDEAQTVLDRIGGRRPQEHAAALVERSLLAAARADPLAAQQHARAALDAFGSWGEPEHLDRVRAQRALAVALRAGAPTPAQRREAAELDARIEEALLALGARGGPESLARLADFADFADFTPPQD